MFYSSFSWALFPHCEKALAMDKGYPVCGSLGRSTQTSESLSSIPAHRHVKTKTRVDSNM